MVALHRESAALNSVKNCTGSSSDFHKPVQLTVWDAEGAAPTVCALGKSSERINLAVEERMLGLQGSPWSVTSAPGLRTIITNSIIEPNSVRANTERNHAYCHSSSGEQGHFGPSSECRVLRHGVCPFSVPVGLEPPNGAPEDGLRNAARLESRPPCPGTESTQGTRYLRYNFACCDFSSLSRCTLLLFSQSWPSSATLPSSASSAPPLT